MNNIMEEKVCIGCGKSKIVDYFLLKHGKITAGCKECINESKRNTTRLTKIQRKDGIPLIERFSKYYEAIPIAGCWIWTGGLSGDSGGYKWAQINIKRDDGAWRPEPAYRTSWKIYRGEIPNGLWVLHSCDNPFCVNPEHLFLGTPKDNTQDMMRKCRHWTQKYRNIQHGC